MRKTNKYRELILQNKREKHRLKQLRSDKSYKGFLSTYNKIQKHREDIDRKIIENFRSELYNFFIERKFITTKENSASTIVFPNDFSFSNNYDVSIDFIRHFIASAFENRGSEITLDFSKCNYVDQPALFVLQILRMDFNADFEKLNNKLNVLSSKTTYKIIQAETEYVNKLLLVTGIIPQTDLRIDGLMPIHTTGYFKGSKAQKHYTENKKGIIGTRIVTYINQCLSNHGYSFNPDGINYMDGLISEILNNAEDHSPFSTYYVTANMLSEIKPDQNGELVGELNLSFMNFGFSYFEGFEQSKNENFDIYNQMEELFNQVNIGVLKKPFTKENLFTLYALQDGMSRLKFKEESRGTGTIKFINSFFAFGDFEDEKKGYQPNLAILSGGTLLICNNKYKPFSIDGVFYISLNKEKSLAVLPDKNNLKTLTHKFPGTLLNTKIYLNKSHLSKKLN